MIFKDHSVYRAQPSADQLNIRCLATAHFCLTAQKYSSTFSLYCNALQLLTGSLFSTVGVSVPINENDHNRYLRVGLMFKTSLNYAVGFEFEFGFGSLNYINILTELREGF